MGQMELDRKVLGIWKFLEGGQRRGAHVSVPKIGSRGAHLCFGGISGSYADLRREWVWGNLDLMVFWFLGVSPREVTEEGGTFVRSPCAFGGTFNVIWVGFVSS
jgi:hypothetical protein